MAQGLKTSEYRRRCRWIEQRLFVVNINAPKSSNEHCPTDDVKTIDPELYSKRVKQKYDLVQFRNKMAPDSPMFITEFKGVKRLEKLPQKVQKDKKMAQAVGRDPDEAMHYYEIKLGRVIYKNSLANEVISKLKRQNKMEIRKDKEKLAKQAQKEKELKEKEARKAQREAARLAKLSLNKNNSKIHRSSVSAGRRVLKKAAAVRVVKRKKAAKVLTRRKRTQAPAVKRNAMNRSMNRSVGRSLNRRSVSRQ